MCVCVHVVYVMLRVWTWVPRGGGESEPEWEEEGQSGRHRALAQTDGDSVLWDKGYVQLNSAPEINKIIDEINGHSKITFCS